MIRVGLTGTIGSGKSTVGRLWEEWGAWRIDADELARRAVRAGSPAFRRIRASWGDRVLAADGTLDRSALRALVAADPEARARLERIVHPAVGELRRERLAEAAAAAAEIVVEEIPLLLEVGMEAELDQVVAVDAPFELRRERARSARDVTDREFRAMDAAQLPGAEKRARADVVIENDGSLAELEARAWEAWAGIEARAGVTGPGGRWAVDLHSHTSASADCLSEPGEVVERARAVGLERIAITDHDAIAGALEAFALAPELVIVGEEVRSAEGPELIGLFLQRHIPPGQPFRRIAEEVRGQGGVTYLPHPFDPRRGAGAEFLDGVADCVDVVEGFNARVHAARANERARAWARERGLGLGAGSDAHLRSEIGRGRALLRPFDGPAGFRRAAGSARLLGRSSGRWVHLGSTWAKLRKRLSP